MKTKIFLMSVVALLTSSCSNNEDGMTQQSADKKIAITAQLAPKNNGTNSPTNIKTDWTPNEHIAILYETNNTKKMADATITAVNSATGGATISFTLDNSTPDNTKCTLVYPLSAVKNDLSGVKDKTTLLETQDGSFNENLDVRVGAGTIHTTAPSLTITTQLEAQFAIFKFTVQDFNEKVMKVSEFIVSDEYDNVITTIKPISATSELYAALPVMDTGTYWYSTTFDDKNYISKISISTPTKAGEYYDTIMKMATIGNVIASNGKFYANNAATPSGNTALAMITSVGIGTGEESKYSHGLALAMSDAGSKLKWSISEVNAHEHQYRTSIFPYESGLQYNDTKHNSATYPAFQAAMSYNNGVSPRGCSAWFLPTGYQWNLMFTSVGSSTDLRDSFSSVGGTNMQSAGYWTSTEHNQSFANYFDFSKGYWGTGSKIANFQVRACIAF